MSYTMDEAVSTDEYINGSINLLIASGINLSVVFTCLCYIRSNYIMTLSNAIQLMQN